jgi:hypothetical protein
MIECVDLTSLPKLSLSVERLPDQFPNSNRRVGNRRPFSPIAMSYLVMKNLFAHMPLNRRTATVSFSFFNRTPAFSIFTRILPG